MSVRSALVVDDSRSARFALRKYLEAHDYQVEAVESAALALDYLRRHRPEVIFLDHIMPGTDGFETLRSIKSDPLTVNIPVVICSSNEGLEFTAQARARGAADVLQKPPSPQQLVAVLGNLRQLPAAPAEGAPQRLDSAVTAPATADRAPEPMQTPLPARVPERVLLDALHGGLAQGGAEPPAAVDTAAAEPPLAPVSAWAVPARAEPPVTGEPAPTPGPAADESASMPEAVSLDTLREIYEARLYRITHDLYAQLGDIRASIALIQAAQAQPVAAAPPPNAADIGALIQGLQQTEHRVARLEQELLARVDQLRLQLETGLQLQSQRMDQLAEAARAVAADEAQAVAERTVMSAASSMSDRLAESILKALGRA